MRGSKLINLLFPAKCVLCREVLDDEYDFICPACVDKLPTVSGEKRIKKGEFFTRCICATLYRGELREAFLRYKFGGRKAYCEYFGDLVANAVAESGETFDVLTWVPISEKRQRKRGYDQTFLMAQVIGRELNIEVVPMLRRVRHTKAQSSISGAEKRRANVFDAFECIGGVEGRKILLVDDIITTGATMAECARTLLEAGAGTVRGCALSRAD